VEAETETVASDVFVAVDLMRGTQFTCFTSTAVQIQQLQAADTLAVEAETATVPSDVFVAADLMRGTQFTCFTGTAAQIQQCKYSSTNTAVQILTH
jgi:hypothetical protein